MSTLFNAPEPDDDLNHDRAVIVAVFIGMVVATAFAIGGFFLIRDNSGSMGSVLFLLLPIATGFATALVVRGKRLIVASLCLAVVLSSSVLLFTGMEGWVCVLMSAPLVIF